MGRRCQATLDCEGEHTRCSHGELFTVYKGVHCEHIQLTNMPHTKHNNLWLLKTVCFLLFFYFSRLLCHMNTYPHYSSWISFNKTTLEIFQYDLVSWRADRTFIKKLLYTFLYSIIITLTLCWRRWFNIEHAFTCSKRSIFSIKYSVCHSTNVRICLLLNLVRCYLENWQSLGTVTNFKDLASTILDDQSIAEFNGTESVCFISLLIAMTNILWAPVGAKTNRCVNTVRTTGTQQATDDLLLVSPHLNCIWNNFCFEHETCSCEKPEDETHSIRIQYLSLFLALHKTGPNMEGQE